MVMVTPNLNKQGVWTVNGELTNPNLFLNADFHSTYNQTTGWDTIKNGTLLATSWGGYNAGVSNPSTCYHAHLTKLDGDFVYEYIRESEGWLGVSQGGLQSKLLLNTEYTFSVDQYIAEGSANFLDGGLYYYKTGATSAAFHLGRFNGRNKEKGRWIRLVYHFTTSSDMDLAKNVSWYIYGANGTGTVYMKQPKLEIGNKMTPFTLSSSEGYMEGNHGLIEKNNSVSIYNNFITAHEFYEI